MHDQKPNVLERWPIAKYNMIENLWEALKKGIGGIKLKNREELYSSLNLSLCYR